MFATVTRWTFKAGSEDEVRRVNTDVLVPMLAKQPGFAHYYAVHTGPEQWTTVVLWQSQHDAQQAYGQVGQSIIELQGHLTLEADRREGPVDLAAGGPSV